MFDWFWKFLYSITSTLFELIDGLLTCANKLCGIEPVNFDGEPTDFLSHLLFSEEVGFAFRVTVIVGIILVVLFSIFAILRTITKEKAEGTPTQICVKAFKSIVTFLFVPSVMIAFIYLGNTLMQAIYRATLNGATSPGNFLFCAFAQESGMSAEHLDKFMTGSNGYSYTNSDIVAACLPGGLSEFSYIFSWLAGGVILFSLASAMFIFVDRVLSIVILYIVAPISISSSMLDDGARFKLWRDQLLTKFIMGYGMIIALNVYAIVCAIVMDPALLFFDSSFANLVMKLLLIGGGALTLQKSMALIGNLVSQGAGSNELRDNALTAGGVARAAKGLAGGALGAAATLTGAKFGASILSNAAASKSRDLGDKLLSGIGLATQNTDLTQAKLDKARMFLDQNRQGGAGGGNPARDAINGIGNAATGGDGRGGGEQGGGAGGGPKNDLLNNAITGSGFKTSDWGGGSNK